jgi:hypothetical protein
MYHKFLELESLGGFQLFYIEMLRKLIHSHLVGYTSGQIETTHSHNWRYLEKAFYK